jgi:molybdopterin molybdotransferase
MSAPLSVEDARQAMLSAATALESEIVALASALRRVLAAPVLSTRDQPPFAVSAMDGYALRAADAPGKLRLIGESAAGRGFDGVCGAGQAVRISTGAAVPQGADTVVIQEDVRRDGETVEVPAAKPGANIRPQGGDFKAGAELLSKGRRLDGVALSLAAASGQAELSVMRKPRIAILSSGDELVPPGASPGRWQIFESATFGVSALVSEWGGEATKLAIEKDDVAGIARAAHQGLRESDLLVVIGGASVGDHDHARVALMSLGLELLVEKVAVRPGKPTWFGVTGIGPVLGLPGNPASALVCAHLFLKPLIEKMLGRDPSVKLRKARLAKALPVNGPREHYLRARLDSDDSGTLIVRSFEDQDSSLHSVFAAANALIRLQANALTMNEGALVDVLPLNH